MEDVVATQPSSLLRISYMILTTLLITGVLILYRLYFGSRAMYSEEKDPALTGTQRSISSNTNDDDDPSKANLRKRKPFDSSSSSSSSSSTIAPSLSSTTSSTATTTSSSLLPSHESHASTSMQITSTIASGTTRTIPQSSSSSSASSSTSHAQSHSSSLSHSTLHHTLTNAHASAKAGTEHLQPTLSAQQTSKTSLLSSGLQVPSAAQSLQKLPSSPSTNLESPSASPAHSASMAKPANASVAATSPIHVELTEERINSLRRKHIQDEDDAANSPAYHTPPLTAWPEEIQDSFSYKATQSGQLTVKVVRGRSMQAKSAGEGNTEHPIHPIARMKSPILKQLLGMSSPYCTIRLDDQQIQTSTVNNSLEPEWAESFKFNIESASACLIVTVLNDDFYSTSDNYMGSARIPVTSLPFGDWKDAWYNLGFGYGEINLQLKFAPATQEKVNKDAFVLLKVLGRGTYGKVHLVSKKDDNMVYAMKVMRKDIILSRNKVQSTQMERHVLQTIKSPFLVGLKYSFQTSSKLYLVLDYVSGGELFFHLKRRHHFQEPEVIFYAAEIVLGLEALHQLNIVYRDLKPENVMLDDEGHVKLTDFGLCKQLDEQLRTKTFCGTPEYLAPEVLLGEAYGLSFDWWCLGVLVFEMLVGLPPFYHRNKNIMYMNILKAPLVIPTFLSEDAASFLRTILDRNPNRRLGCGAQGVQEIKNHPFFKSINWAEAKERKLEPPMKPFIDHPQDVRNFDPNVTRETPHDSYFESNISASMQELFAGFSYQHGELETVPE